MAISFTCSECDGDIKVKDEFAGRKIKCPSCKEVVTVPGKENAVAAGPPRKSSQGVMDKERRRKSAEVEDEDDEDEPAEEKKKSRKKKKKKSNTGLIIGVGVGVGVLLIGIILALVFLLPSRPAPQVQAKKPPEEKKEPPPSKKEEQDPKLPPKKNLGTAGRQRDLIEYKHHFKELGLAYQFMAAENKAPKSKEDFRKFFRGSGPVVQNLDSGYIQFIYGVLPSQLPEGASNTIVGYEPHADNNGQRIVLMGDGSVQVLNMEEYARAPKAKGP